MNVFKRFWNGFSPFTRAVFIRALKTVGQTAVAIMLTSDRISGVNWRDLIDVAGMAGMLSILTSATAGVPESPLQLPAPDKEA